MCRRSFEKEATALKSSLTLTTGCPTLLAWLREGGVFDLLPSSDGWFPAIESSAARKYEGSRKASLHARFLPGDWSSVPGEALVETSQSSRFAGRVEQLADFVQNHSRRLAFLQKGINMESRTLWNMRHAREHQNSDIRLNPLHSCGRLMAIAVGQIVIEQN